MVTQTLVSAVDPAFRDPAKFVGQVYERDEAEKLAREHGWTVKPDGEHWRRVVPSPTPRRVVETRLIRRMAREGVVVVCAGGGGVPVIRDERGSAHRRRGGRRQGPDRVAPGRGAGVRRVPELDRRAPRDARLRHPARVRDRAHHPARAARAGPARPGRWAPRWRRPAGSWSTPATWPPSA
ncbi:hypothetical protein ACFSTC_35670 [Nonomuraea ferruginea]